MKLRTDSERRRNPLREEMQIEDKTKRRGKRIHVLRRNELPSEMTTTTNPYPSVFGRKTKREVGVEEEHEKYGMI